MSYVTKTTLSPYGEPMTSYTGTFESVRLNTIGARTVDGSPQGDYYLNGVWHNKPPQPQPYMTWVWESHTWEDLRTPEEVSLWDEERWVEVRAERDRLLTATDWRVVRAYEQGQQLAPEWQAYRQALRDVTDQPDPYNIVWPETPA